MSVYSGPNTAQSGLVLHIDASNPRCYPGSGSTLFDLSGQGNNGTLTNGASVVTNRAGRALNFDGTDDYVLCAQKTAISSQSCFSAWIYPRSVATYQIIIAEDSGNASATLRNFVFGYGLTSGKLLVVDFVGSTFNVHESDAVLVANAWQHVAWNRSTSGLSFYKNGVIVGSFAYTGSLNQVNIQTRIGARQPPASEQPINGQIDDIRIYNRAFSPAEIAQNYHATKGRYGL
jgi:hypothetical protein